MNLYVNLKLVRHVFVDDERLFIPTFIVLKWYPGYIRVYYDEGYGYTGSAIMPVVIDFRLFNCVQMCFLMCFYYCVVNCHLSVSYIVYPSYMHICICIYDCLLDS